MPKTLFSAVAPCHRRAITRKNKINIRLWAPPRRTFGRARMGRHRVGGRPEGNTMNLLRRAFLGRAGAMLAAAAAPPHAWAQSYPSRPLTMVVPYPAGGPTDAVARILAEGLRAPLGQPVVIENVSGAGGSLGLRRVARAAADGYTLSIGQLNSHVFGGAIYGALYDVLMDFDPVALLTTNPLMFQAV
jgi:hypothetical protein